VAGRHYHEQILIKFGTAQFHNHPKNAAEISSSYFYSLMSYGSHTKTETPFSLAMLIVTTKKLSFCKNVSALRSRTSHANI
jgi:hypothetical protein